MQPALVPLCLALLLFCALPAPAAAPVEGQIPVREIVDRAVERFSRMKAKPNLVGAPVERVWGKANKPFTQAYT